MPDDTFACHGPCDGGRKPCPCPDACSLHDDDQFGFVRGAINLVAITAAVAAVAMLVITVL